MEQKKLMNDLKNKEFKSPYLLYGEERYLVSYYANAIEKAVLLGDTPELCKDTFDGKVPANDIIMAADTLPFFSDRRLIFIRDSGLFATGRKDDSETISQYIANVPKETIMVFVESDVDRRSKLFKQITKFGSVLDCTPPTPQMLSAWTARLAKEKGKTLTNDIVQHFIRTVGTNMTSISQEMSKLIAYCNNHQNITIKDIDAICTPTLDSRVFDLIKAMCAGRTGDALKLYRDILILKESPIMVLTMIIRQFRIILLSLCAKEKGMTIVQTAKELNLRDFMVAEALGQSKKYTVNTLMDTLMDCQDTDIKVKTGLITPELGVEMLIIKASEVV